MSDPIKSKDRPVEPGPYKEPDFAARLTRAEFGRHYVDPMRVEQTLRGGEIVFRDKASSQGRKRR